MLVWTLFFMHTHSICFSTCVSFAFLLFRNQKPKSSGEEFYSLLYLGLFNEARGETGKAESYMRAAAKSRYGKVVGSQDYMVDVAKVHCKLRHWV
jgi:hypothetical protein